MMDLRRMVPDTMAGRSLLLLLVAMTFSNFASMIIWFREGNESFDLLGEHAMLQRVASIAHVVIEVPPSYRKHLVEVMNEPNFRIMLSSDFAAVGNPDAAESWREGVARRYIETLLPYENLGPIRIRLLGLPENGTASDRLGWAPGYLRRMLAGAGLQHRLQASIRLPDGAWILFDGGAPTSDYLWFSRATTSTLAMLIAVVIATTLIVRRLIRPLQSMASTAERLGRDIAAPPMKEDGPREVRQAVRALNDMQERLRRLVENRTRMLTAISHDLRSPITLLRLRAELIEDKEERQKTFSTLDEMEKMIAATLAFAREDAEPESRKVVDLAALIDAICTDLAEAGGDVICEVPDHLAYECAPVALRRALVNLLDNALKYGQRARVRLSAERSHVLVTIEDDGPGIPKDRRQDVFAPFVRIEESRNVDTGGVGLGLSIAQSVIHAHGGDILLENRPEGGLSVSVQLPT